MNRKGFALMLASLGLLFVQTAAFARPSVSAAPSQQPQYVRDQILIKFKPGATAAARSQAAQTYGASTMQTVGSKKDVVLAKLIRGQSVEQAVRDLSSDPGVEYAQPNYIYHAQAVPTDPQYGQLWAAKNTGQTMLTGSYVPATGSAGRDMNLEAAWDIQTDCSSVVVAVLDTGINYNSEDLSANMWTDLSGTDTMHGQNFAADVVTGVNSDPMDRNGHGTHVAGIIGAVANSVGGVGVCWTAKLMAVRVLDATGSGTTTTILDGIDYAIANDAKVINMSLAGAGGEDLLFRDAITRAQNADVLVVVAAGNDSQNNDTTANWPCNFTHPNLVCVAALDQDYNLASFSNYGATSVDVGAPGTNIYSTWAGAEVVANDFSDGGAAPAGWTLTGGWAAEAGGWLVNPAANWGTTLYANNADDRAYKTFDLGTVDVAVVDMYIAINVQNLDYLRLNSKSAGGDPFSGGINLFAITNVASGGNAPHLAADISSCISTNCSIGFQLTSNVTGADIGVALTNFTITTMTLNSTSYKTINGTSMASPQVAGIAALVRARNPLYTYADTAAAIKNGGDFIPALSDKTTTGRAVDALGSLTYINPPTGISVTVH